MNREETLALYAQGRDAWNSWAEMMLAERKDLEEKGKWGAELKEFGRLVPSNDATRAWMVAAAADFSSGKVPFEFNDVVDFSGWKFPGDVGFANAKFQSIARFNDVTFAGDAEFQGTRFLSDARFNNATFSGTARFMVASFKDSAAFREAKFLGLARFGAATFGGDAWFDRGTFLRKTEFGGATFSGIAGFEGTTFAREVDAGFWGTTFAGEAWFVGTNFMGLTWFTLAVFGGYTTFADANFEKDVHFVAVNGRSFFTLEGVTFAVVPDFEQAHFAEAPRLDIFQIRRGRATPELRERTGPPEAREGKEEPRRDWPEGSISAKKRVTANFRPAGVR